MEFLLQKLKELVSDDTIVPSEFLTDGEPDQLPVLLQEIIELACGELIDSQGRPNYPTMDRLKDAGFPVSKGEGDSFGWLSGCISTPKGVVVYG